MGSYNPLASVEVNDFELGLCPVCCRRLTAECGHVTTMEGQAWYAVFIAAEQMLRNDLTEVADMRPNWQVEAEADAQEFRDIKFGSKQWFAELPEIHF